MAHLLMCHHFHGGAVRASHGSYSDDDLGAVIEHYDKHNVLIDAREWLLKAQTGRLTDEVALSFDDGLRCQYDIALPVLRDHRLTAFWFVCSSPFVGDPLLFEVFRTFVNQYFATVGEFYVAFNACVSSTFQQQADAMPSDYLEDYSFYSPADRRFRYLRDVVLGDQYQDIMRGMIASRGVLWSDLVRHIWMDQHEIANLHYEGHVIGLHSHTHPTRMASLNRDRQQLEYELCASAVRRITHAEPQCVAHPCNSRSPETIAVLRQLGIQVGFCSSMHTGSWLRMEMPREDIADVRRRVCA